MTTAHVLRVFTDENGAHGNHLGIVIEGDAPLTPGRRQAIATELGYSETVFFQDVETAALRIFTPAVELPLAGHPLVGASWFLAQRGLPTRTLRPALAAELATSVEDGATWIRARVADAPPFEYVQVESEAAVRALQPGPEWAHHYVWAWTDRDAGRVYLRLLAPDLGVPEDPATGSGALVLASRLGRAVDIVQAAGCVLKARPAAHDGWSEVGGFVVSDGTRRSLAAYAQARLGDTSVKRTKSPSRHRSSFWKNLIPREKGIVFRTVRLSARLDSSRMTSGGRMRPSTGLDDRCIAQDVE